MFKDLQKLIPLVANLKLRFLKSKQEEIRYYEGLPTIKDKLVTGRVKTLEQKQENTKTEIL